MADYTPTTDFSAKDSLPTGDANKIIKGSDFDVEFSAIETAVATKYDSTDLGVAVQAYDAQLASIAALSSVANLEAIAGLTSAANKVPRFTGSGTAELIDVAYGTYAATVTAGTNAASASAVADFCYTRVGNIVTVSGAINVDPTSASTVTLVYASLPIASDFSANGDACGTINSANIPLYGSGVVSNDSTNDRLLFSYISGSDVSNASFRFTAQYIIK